ncbi:MAG: cyclophilin-like family protein [Acidobacteriota bacterium]
MSEKIKFSISARLLESPLAEAVRRKPPFSSRVNRWGEEIYFSVPVSQELAPGARRASLEGEQ